MADFAGEEIDLLEMIDGRTAAQIIEGSGSAMVASPVRESFGPGWFADVHRSDVSTGKAQCDG